MLDTREIIPSKDVREYMKKQGRALTDFEKATLIYNHSSMNHEEKTKALESILKVTADEALRVQIQNRLTHDKQCLKKFYEREDDEIYVLNVFIAQEQEWTECGYYLSGELAVACGKKFKERFSVYKMKVITEEKEPEQCYSKQIAALYFTADGVMRNYYSNESIEIEMEDGDGRGRFEYAYIDISHPFKNGDVVKVIHNEPPEDKIGIVECCKELEEKDIHEQRCKYCDYGDVSLRVATMQADARFGHEHIPIVDIEYATLEEEDLRKPVFDCASDLLKGCGGLSDLQYVCEEYRRMNRL